MNFEARQKKLRAPGIAKFYDKAEKKLEQAKDGLSREDYWKNHVKTREDALTYYDLYYPEYPDVLKEALVLRIDQLRKECIVDDELYKRHCVQPTENKKWDYMKEIQDQNMQGLIAVANKRLDQLLLTADSELKPTVQKKKKAKKSKAMTTTTTLTDNLLQKEEEHKQ